MIVYWVMFAWPALSTFLWSGNEYRRASRLSLLTLFIVFCILIGLRTDTGGDWIPYAEYAQAVSFVSLSTALAANNEPAFAIITWISTRIGLDVYGPSTVCGIILMWGIIRFARRQPDSWLSITAAVPYLIIVVGMGYVRQAAAIGLIIVALLHFESGRTARCIIYLILSTLFHTSAIVIFPFVAFVVSRKNILYAVPSALGTAFLFSIIIRNKLDLAMQNYIEAKLDSSGTLIRLLMNAVPATIFLLYRKKFVMSEDMRLIWTMFSFTSCLLLLAFPFSPSSTILDRLGLYMIPIQLLVFGHLPSVFASKPHETGLVSYFAIGYFAAVQFVWLNYADTAFAWVPYRSLLTS